MVSVKRIRESLLAQLKAKGADVDLYRALIDDYCWLFQQQREMQRDIRKRGRTYKAWSASGNEYDKENPAVKNALLYSRQMLAVLDKLGLDTKTVVGGTSADDEDL